MLWPQASRVGLHRRRPPRQGVRLDMRVGIVGLGYRLAYLARIFSVESDEFSVVGYVDPAPAGLPYTQEHGVSVGKQYATLDAMLAAEHLDLLMIGAPNLMHLDYIKAGLEHGLKVFTEKPVVTLS